MLQIRFIPPEALQPVHSQVVGGFGNGGAGFGEARHSGFSATTCECTGRFVSLALVVEETKEGYYDSLYRSSQDWHKEKQSLLPWTEYFLGVMMLTAYREFEERVGVLTTARGAKTAIVMDAIERLLDGFKMVDVERGCPNVRREMIRVVLNSLKKDGKIHCVGFGAGAVWKKGPKKR